MVIYGEVTVGFGWLQLVMSGDGVVTGGSSGYGW